MLARRLLSRHPCGPAATSETVVEPAEMIRKEAAAVEQSELQVRKSIEDATINHVADGECRICWIPAYGAQSISAHLIAAGDPFRMHDHQHVQLLGFGPKRVKVFAVVIFTDYIGSEGHAGHFEITDRLLQNASGTRRVLQRYSGDADKTIGVALD